MRRAASLLALFAILALLGCGDSDETSAGTDADLSSTQSETTTATSADDDKMLVAALGDSITAGSPIWDPDPQVRAQIGPDLDEQSQYEYWATRADPSLEFRNCGVFGERTDEIATRLDGCADGADALVIQGGINDIAQGRSVVDAARDLTKMVERGKNLGIPVALVEVLPWNNGQPYADRPIEQLNALIGQIGEDEDIPVMPFYETLEDPGNPGTMRADLTIDGDHPSVAGYKLLAEKAFELPQG